MLVFFEAILIFVGVVVAAVAVVAANAEAAGAILSTFDLLLAVIELHDGDQQQQPLPPSLRFAVSSCTLSLLPEQPVPGSRKAQEPHPNHQRSAYPPPS